VAVDVVERKNIFFEAGFCNAIELPLPAGRQAGVTHFKVLFYIHH